MAELRIGTCSWKFPSWSGLVYSAPKGINYLEEYASKYDTVEVDQWFWSLFGQDSIRLPTPFEVEAYRSAVPVDFRFSIKAPNSVALTHFYKKKKSDPLVENPFFLSNPLFAEFLSILDSLNELLGPIMFQFEYLNRQKMASQSRFLEQLTPFVRQLPSHPRYGVEVRNASYLNQAYFEFLNRNGLSHVFVQGYWMPPITQLYQKWRSAICQQELVVIRLMGPDRQGIEKQTRKRWDQIVAPKDDELVAIADMIEDLLDLGINVYLNVNNHYEGSAPLTIERIKAFL